MSSTAIVYPKVEILWPEQDLYSSVIVTETADEYICICGMKECRMTKMKSAKECAERYNIHTIDAINDTFVNEYIACTRSGLCKFPDTYCALKQDINLLWFEDGRTRRRQHGLYAGQRNYVTSNGLLPQILQSLKEHKTDLMKTRYQLWRADKDMYMSRLPSDILNLILVKVTYDTRYDYTN